MPTPSGPERRSPAEAATEHPEITYIGCARCGTLIAGLDGRYACSGCGWVNEWTEGHRPLPAARRRRAQGAPPPAPATAHSGPSTGTARNPPPGAARNARTDDD
ncbi:hypothetical protein [Streptomyces sp. TRM75563]|uniref:hypothetical protein n=1 Tax=Streptomyces sp. TRM75563 TaxID=2817418 RepID=UPI001F622C71|nr:hypothetical protein [Streptomyces sp. TRM75563]MCI4043622.1 hypothetical protein [Streptomyces sp. TRM75563]